MTKTQLLERIRATETDINIVREMDIRTIEESAAADISTFLGYIDTFDVCLVLECLRHLDSIKSGLDLDL